MCFFIVAVQVACETKSELIFLFFIFYFTKPDKIIFGPKGKKVL